MGVSFSQPVMPFVSMLSPILIEKCTHRNNLNDYMDIITLNNRVKAAFKITYFFFIHTVHTAATLTKYALLHTVCIQFGHTTVDVTKEDSGAGQPKSNLACILGNVTGCSTTSWYFWHTAFFHYMYWGKYFSVILNSMVVWGVEQRAIKPWDQKRVQHLPCWEMVLQLPLFLTRPKLFWQVTAPGHS